MLLKNFNVELWSIVFFVGFAEKLIYIEPKAVDRKSSEETAFFWDAREKSRLRGRKTPFISFFTASAAGGASMCATNRPVPDSSSGRRRQARPDGRGAGPHRERAVRLPLWRRRNQLRPGEPDVVDAARKRFPFLATEPKTIIPRSDPRGVGCAAGGLTARAHVAPRSTTPSRWRSAGRRRATPRRWRASISSKGAHTHPSYAQARARAHSHARTHAHARAHARARVRARARAGGGRAVRCACASSSRRQARAR